MMQLIKYILIIPLLLFLGCLGQLDNKEEDFRTFLAKFSGDKEFQMNRIQFPLEFHSLSYNYDSTIVEYVVLENWEHKSIFFNEHCNSIFPQVYDNFRGELRKSSERLFALRGIESGVAEFYYFKLINGKWFLVKVEDFST